MLLIPALSDTVEVWRHQLEGLADRYRLTSFDIRGSGRTALPDGRLTMEMMADDAAGVIEALDIAPAHVTGFSLGSMISQELALRHPHLVRSLVLVSTWGRADAYFTAMTAFWRWMVSAAPSDRAALEAFYLWIYTARGHDDGTVAQIIDEVLAFPYPQSVEAFQAQVDAFRTHSTLDRLHRIAAPTLVLAGGADLSTPPRLGQAVAEAVPGARFEILPGEAHQPFQEIPEQFNARVDEFWAEVERSEHAKHANDTRIEGGRDGYR